MTLTNSELASAPVFRSRIFVQEVEIPLICDYLSLPESSGAGNAACNRWRRPNLQKSLAFTL